MRGSETDKAEIYKYNPCQKCWHLNQKFSVLLPSHNVELLNILLKLSLSQKASTLNRGGGVGVMVGALIEMFALNLGHLFHAIFHKCSNYFCQRFSGKYGCGQEVFFV